ncbi:hypothetical protein GCM10011399_01420 [Subtercola lobariae]|uniref:Helix-turn-helix domain-containing protein n=1 Tax=Subtercola lobariae TaxID=1588641 RepID=A0A917ETH4_9MICO|nr:hypothetical protein GCM10011399_01420 [Subtercola lobariae]
MAVAYSVKGAAKTAAISEQTVVMAIRNGELIARRVAGKIVIVKRDIKSWLNSCPDAMAHLSSNLGEEDAS